MLAIILPSPDYTGRYSLDGDIFRPDTPDTRDMSALEVSPFHGIAYKNRHLLTYYILTSYYDWNNVGGELSFFSF